jgi:hypothetical protein
LFVNAVLRRLPCTVFVFVTLLHSFIAVDTKRTGLRPALCAVHLLVRKIYISGTFITHSTALLRILFWAIFELQHTPNIPVSKMSFSTIYVWEGRQADR